MQDVLHNPTRADLVRLQELLLPTGLPSVGCTEAAAAYRPHNDELRLGGDWYDLIDLPQRNEIVAIVGDVVGHGLEQISVMGQLRAASNALAHVCSEPHEILAALDKFAANVPTAAMTTAAVLMMDGTSTARLASAGHPPPLRARRNGEIDLLEGGKRPPLTVGGGGRSVRVDIAIGDVIVLYTDGVIERRGESLDAALLELGEFLSRRVEAACSEIATAIVDEFAGAAQDDVAVLVLRPLHLVDAGSSASA